MSPGMRSRRGLFESPLSDGVLGPTVAGGMGQLSGQARKFSQVAGGGRSTALSNPEDKAPMPQWSPPP
jgi:hypothetical protein